jgi:hypothetical protein
MAAGFNQISYGEFLSFSSLTMMKACVEILSRVFCYFIHHDIMSVFRQLRFKCCCISPTLNVFSLLCGDEADSPMLNHCVFPNFALLEGPMQNKHTQTIV